jgi:hypothetical protein
MNSLSTIVLDQHYEKLGISYEQKEMLKNYLEFFPTGSEELSELALQCNTTLEQVQEWLTDLHSRFVFPFIAPYQLDIDAFHSRIQDYYYNFRSLEDRIVEANRLKANYDSFDEVKLEVLRINQVSYSGIGVFSNGLYKQMWSKKDMEELAHSILKFTKEATQSNIDSYNQYLEEKHKKAQEHYRLQAEKEQEERQLKKNTPDPGFVFLVRLFPSGTYRFTHTTSLNVVQKTEKIKEEYNNQVEIIHTLETKFTSKFLHQFIRKEFRTRLIQNGSGYEYELSDKDIAYIHEENFPPQAMEWLN